jgi:3-isopropylmalate/(R)-2-methylmalate dehydratase small subunit
VAETYARIFFRNCVATGEVFPYETPQRLCDVLRTGDEVTIDFTHDTLTHGATVYNLKPLGEVRPVVEAGGIFNYARQTGMIPQRPVAV